MSLRELLLEPDRLAFLGLALFVILTLGVAVGVVRRQRQRPAATEPAEPVTTWPYLLRIELVATLVVLLLLSWWAILLELPAGTPADPTLTPSIAKAPWFFVGIQELLRYFDPWLAGALLPLLAVFGLAALPYLDRAPDQAGVYRFRPAALLVLLALLGFWLLPSAIGLFLRGEHWSFTPIWRPAAPDQVAAPVLSSLGERLGLGARGSGLLGAALCLGPLILLVLLWPALRRREWAARLGLARYLVTGGLLLSLAGVALKVVLVLGLDIRYLWVTPWFRI